MPSRLTQISFLLRVVVAVLFIAQTALAPLDALARTEPASDRFSPAAGQLRRWKVSAITTYDGVDGGLGNSSRREYVYGGALGIDYDGTDHYLGHQLVRIWYYAKNAEQTVQQMEETWFHQGNTNSLAGQDGKPDPRVGRPFRNKIHRPKGAAVPVTSRKSTLATAA